MSKSPKPAVGAVFPDGLYHVAELRRILRWGRVSFTKAKRNGLPVLRLGRCSYCRGGDVIAYIEGHATVEGDGDG